MYARKGRRWFHRMLAAVDPSAFADSLETYIGGLSPDEVRALALKSLKALPPAERAQLALYVDPKLLAGTGDDLIGRRFTAFLRQNPRAAGCLGSEVLEQTLVPLQPPEMRNAQTRRFKWNAAGIGLLALLLAFLPLAAQYAHQSGMLSGLTDASIAPPLPLPAVHRVAFVPHVAVHHRSAAPAVHHSAAHPGAAGRHNPHAQLPQQRIARVAVQHAHHAAVRRVAANVWKFDRRNYAYFSESHRTLQERARLEVQSYLNAVIAGNTRSALQHLGLPPDADLVNLSEVPIITRSSHARVVWVKPTPDGKTQVDADIHGRKGEYFEVFYVAADGPAVRITDRYYIPVGKSVKDITR